MHVVAEFNNHVYMCSRDVYGIRITGKITCKYGTGWAPSSLKLLCDRTVCLLFESDP